MNEDDPSGWLDQQPEQPRRDLRVIEGDGPQWPPIRPLPSPGDVSTAEPYPHHDVPEAIGLAAACAFRRR
ncbi:hypothetical protein D5125_17115 [Magnetovirga frankeli]|uniref:hypothetical protein n=1 Tax=Magnetovirga frankeli TaxID=947516 RepID=UPI001293E84E|nr:hypothetical protein D5125_17115 [gamma proteobacterium SS-5]